MTVIEVLKRFGPKQATKDDVMRALASHDGWFAPATFAMKAFQTNAFERLCVWGEASNVPAGSLFLFTSVEAGERSLTRGWSVGPCAGPLAGITIFAGLPDAERIEINPGSPPDEAFYLERGAIAVARLWGAAIALEQAILHQHDDLIDRLVEFDPMLILVRPDGAVATAVGAAGLRNPAMAFTAGDCVDQAIAASGEAGAALRMTGIAAHELFAKIEQFGCDGVLLNPCGPGPGKVFPAEICRRLAEQHASLLELRRLERAAAAAGET